MYNNSLSLSKGQKQVLRDAFKQYLPREIVIAASSHQ